MEKYIGTKQVMATPAIRKGGKVYLPEDEIPRTMDPVEQGYKVVYKDGYESWSPKEVFEEAYKIAETPGDRMKIEDSDLCRKINKLLLFINSEKFEELPAITQAMLIAQKNEMVDYRQLLQSRLNAMEHQYGNIKAVSFSVALSLLKAGFSVRREHWNNKHTFLIKQIPAHIGSDTIPKMQSLPKQAKKLVMDGLGYISYDNQCLIYNSMTGIADNWAPSVTDLFSEDWEVVL